MAHALAFAQHTVPDPVDFARKAAVWICAMALIAAGPSLPGLILP